MTITTRTTELEAVNTILSTIGEAPLSTLTGSLPVDGTTAKNILNEISREVQSAGWHFNTQYKVDLTRDTDNKVPIGTDVVRVQLNDKYDHLQLLSQHQRYEMFLPKLAKKATF